MNRKNLLMLAMALMLVLALGACKKKVQAPPPPPPPPPAAPTASLSANPASIQKGESTTLSWKTTDATDVTIEGIGAVDPNGSKTVSPADSTTYRVIAKGPGGTQESTARVTVTQPPPPPPPPPSLTDQQLFEQNVKDIYFDYDAYSISPAAQTALEANAAFLKQHPNFTFTIEGHCDERGSTEYNLALGDNRASATKQALVGMGVSAGQIKTISFGKEKPVCSESNEQCWQQNRRAHFSFGQQ